MKQREGHNELRGQQAPGFRLSKGWPATADERQQRSSPIIGQVARSVTNSRCRSTTARATHSHHQKPKRDAVNLVERHIRMPQQHRRQRQPETAARAQPSSACSGRRAAAVAQSEKSSPMPAIASRPSDATGISPRSPAPPPETVLSRIRISRPQTPRPDVFPIQFHAPLKRRIAPRRDLPQPRDSRRYIEPRQMFESRSPPHRPADAAWAPPDSSLLSPRSKAAAVHPGCSAAENARAA